MVVQQLGDQSTMSLYHSRFGALMPRDAFWVCVVVPLAEVEALRKQRVHMYMSVLDESAVDDPVNASPYVLAVFERSDDVALTALDVVYSGDQRLSRMFGLHRSTTGARLILDFLALYVTLKDDTADRPSEFARWCVDEAVRHERASPGNALVHRMGFKDARTDDLLAWLIAQKTRIEKEAWCSSIEYCVIPLPRDS
jgi:hypothetical protein